MGLDVAGYGLVRSLAHEGVPVLGLWRREDEAARHSRYCTAVEVAPDEEAAWIGMILELAARFEQPVLFPSSDRYAAMLARHRSLLEEVARFHWVDEGDLESVIDKARMHEACRAAGLPVPLTHHPSEQDLGAQAAGFAFPCLVKPRTTFRRALPGGEKVTICRDEDQLLAVYRGHPGLADATLWQHIIPGEDDHIYQGTALAENGEIRAIACVRKIRQFTPGFGITSFGVTEWQPEVVEQTTRLLGALRWSGLASVEFKRSDADGRWYFIEMNPRLPWYNALFDRAGINLPHLAWRALTGGALEPVRQQDGVHWMSLPSDLASFWDRHAHGTMSFADWLPSLAKADSFAWFDRSDPVPSFANTARLTSMGLRHIAHGLQNL